MPKTRHLAKYPPSYFTLFETASRCNGFTVPCASVKQARSLRFDLYSFLKACDLEEVEAVRHWRSFTLCVEDNPPLLIFRTPDSTAFGTLITATLAAYAIPPADPRPSPQAEEDEASDTLADLGFSTPKSPRDSQ